MNKTSLVNGIVLTLLFIFSLRLSTRLFTRHVSPVDRGLSNLIIIWYWLAALILAFIIGLLLTFVNSYLDAKRRHKDNIRSIFSSVAGSWLAFFGFMALITILFIIKAVVNVLV